jgi:uncharacterized integral membrane protein
MSVLHRNRNTPTAPDAAAPPPPAGDPPAAPVTTVSHTRTSAAWLGVCVAAAVLVVLVIFMLQNTGSVEISFLWLHGSLPLAMALLIAALGAAILTMSVGVARITQLRRRYRRDR